LFGAVALSIALQVLVVHAPLLNTAFSTVPLSLGDWIVCVAIASSVLWAGELRKPVARRRRSSTGAAPIRSWMHSPGGMREAAPEPPLPRQAHAQPPRISLACEWPR